MPVEVVEKAAVNKLTGLPYVYNALEPYISEQLLTLHHRGHYLACFNGANDAENKLYRARAKRSDIGVKSALKMLSFNIGGIMLHDFFWLSLAPAGKNGKPRGSFEAAIAKEFGSMDRFKKEFTRAAIGVEGGGWAVLSLNDITLRPAIMQIEKHNINVCPTFPVIMVIDMWEHAYYLDYKNDRAKYVDAVWNIINWNGISKRWENMMNWIPDRGTGKVA